MSRLTLAQQLAQLDEPAPQDFDPEDAQITGLFPTERASPESADEARAHYIQVGDSELRKRNDALAGPKYEGVRTTRAALDASDSTSEGEDSEEEDHDAPHEAHGPEPSESEADEDAEVSGEEEAPRTVPVDKHPSPPPPAEDITAALRQSRDADRRKGIAVSHQLSIWDALLDARIRMQKGAVAANRLPSHSEIQALQTDAHEDIQAALSAFHAESQALIDELFTLQEQLLELNEADAVKPPPRKRARVSPIASDDSPAALPELAQSFSALEHAYHLHAVHTLHKWSAKIHAVAPSALRTSTSFSGRGQTLGAAQQADAVLADMEKLRARTRVLRSKALHSQHERDGEPEGEEQGREVFDDTDFYQQLLRDVIDRTKDGGGGEEAWVAEQKRRKAAKKSVVDTRASKGRKIRYEVHEKLQAFMPPVPAGTWHDAQVDELFASLLGAGFPDAGMGAADAEEETAGVGEVEMGDFRVF